MTKDLAHALEESTERIGNLESLVRVVLSGERGTGELRRRESGHHRADKVDRKGAWRQGNHSECDRSWIHRDGHDERPSSGASRSCPASDSTEAIRDRKRYRSWGLVCFI